MEGQIYTVSEVNGFIKNVIDGIPQLSGIYIRGELSNYKIYPSGHHYFTLKDGEGALRCVMFKGSAMKLRFRPENGMQVIAYGRISVFPRDGAYQLYCSQLSPDGVGDLYVAFEQLKDKLYREGLFDEGHKKPLPRYPQRIAIVTSSAGAAIHDMIRILRRRYPIARVLLLPVRVQGVEAPPEIVGAIRYANRWKLADVLITGRGGGSMEDLWAFNDERVARAIYACETPVISAVGHEPDVTISDFVADRRASTPSNAAEIAVPDQAELLRHLSGLSDRMNTSEAARLQTLRERLDVLKRKRVLTDQLAYVQDRRMELAHLQQRLGDLTRAAIAEKQKESKNSLLRDKVTEEEIARIVGRWTGIPVTKLMEGEREKLLHMDEVLHRRVIGQDEAVEKVSEAILRSRAGIQDPNRPLGSFLFLGPTGVGKTELAKALAEALFDDENNIVRIDMSEYMEKFSVSRLIGAPPGYVGYEEGGQLTEAVRRKPYSVVLLDEVEKAHPDVFNILLQVLDDGRITDSQGRTVDFKNTIIILTSNLGSPMILEGMDENGNISEEARKEVDTLLKQKFRPEFLNRLDEIVFYKPLSRTEIFRIVDLLLEKLRKRLEDKQLELEVTDAAKECIVAQGYDVNYGARPLKRLIQSKVETLVARKIIADDPAPGTVIRIDYDGQKMICQ